MFLSTLHPQAAIPSRTNYVNTIRNRIVDSWRRLSGFFTLFRITTLWSPSAFSCERLTVVDHQTRHQATGKQVVAQWPLSPLQHRTDSGNSSEMRMTRIHSWCFWQLFWSRLAQQLDHGMPLLQIRPFQICSLCSA